ncbi:predicted protein [Arabidopsis lyrata subsp. lyrata]|uniref:Predicted protein n=1 Tax=Arabidopsis lyrata subsp. lyrata TaxID=81972 RepID=D7KPB7_ARALL|nr:predicted protein [Arabidopsis lyrata subsp. lyrata]
MADILPPLTTKQALEKVDNSNLTCPVGYDFLDKEAFNILNPDYFRGLYLAYCPGFFDEKLHISSTMGPDHYQLGAYYLDQKLSFYGTVNSHGDLSARMQADITDKLIVHAKTELRNTHLYQAQVNFEYLALNYRAQFQLGSNSAIGATYIQQFSVQRVTPRLSLGGEFFWASMAQESGVGYAARYETDRMFWWDSEEEEEYMVASAKVVSIGRVIMTYVQKISKKVSLATDFVYDCFSRDVKTSVGYEWDISRLGMIDSDGVASAILKKEMNMGLECLLSASLDHKNKDYRLGLSLTYG